ncbi:MAG: DUF1993 domain-containing protein [Deltaproteobacteria bacterium]|nr:MAG: DUF1993 domain-containing protein [Deltaproteobacteria bacterium]
MSLYDQTVFQPQKVLNQVSQWIEKAETFAETKKFDPNNLLRARLAPDQFDLLGQLRTLCDTAKLTAARVSGKEAPVHEDHETNLDGIKARLQSVQDFLSGFKPEDFDGVGDNQIVLPFLEGFSVKATDYVLEFGQPNLYFHASTVYAILRHNGVDLGKRDFIGSLRLNPIASE